MTRAVLESDEHDKPVQMTQGHDVRGRMRSRAHALADSTRESQGWGSAQAGGGIWPMALPACAPALEIILGAAAAHPDLISH